MLLAIAMVSGFGGWWIPGEGKRERERERVSEEVPAREKERGKEGAVNCERGGVGGGGDDEGDGHAGATDATSTRSRVKSSPHARMSDE